MAIFQFIGVSAGGVAGIVIGVLAAVVLAALVVLFFLYRDRTPSAAKDPGLPPSIGFDNALYKAGDATTVKIESMGDPSTVA